MYKIAISGKAKSGKDTLSKIIKQEFCKNNTDIRCQYIAFADPIKQMIRLMFPNVPEKHLTGPSQYRSEIIDGAFKDGNPLTVRQLLIDIGMAGRTYKADIWLDAFDVTLKKAEKRNKNLIIASDLRFLNEWEYLNNLRFTTIRLLRNSHLQLNDVSETSQDLIKNENFNFIIENNKKLQDLRTQVAELYTKIL